MPKKILIVDDSALNRFLLSSTLREEYDILEVVNGKEALDLLDRAHASLSAVLLDIVMPVMDGYETLRRVRDNVAYSDIPVIMVTGSEDEESRIKALSLGANDFILKPYNPDIIKHCLKNNIALYETATKLRAIQRDKLTGLYNREAFFERVAEKIAAHEPGHYLLSCFDIDNFKLINDQFGTVEGDRILREIGKTVAEDMAKLDGVGGRISGDNFAVLIPADQKDYSIARFVEKDRMAFSRKQAVVFSVGRYLVSDLSLPINSIYDRAYIAKKSIKGRYDQHIAYFNDAMLEKLLDHQQIISDVHAAVTERQFEVWYQPQRNHVTGALVGAEALVRWRHPERGLIPPGEFIPIFERNGFIYELDQYVWEETCWYLRQWIDEGRNPAPVSVNISRQDLFRPGFVDTLAGLVTKYELPVDLLRLEITESAFAQSTKLIVDVVKQLVALGFIVEIDDFGSGYSSLNTLKNVPAQVVKLDMRFLEDDNDGERGGNILSSIVRMARWLNMSVIAEGVEEKAQADYLVSIGCSYIQGYLYSRPLPAPEYEEYCRSLGKEQRLLSMNTVGNLNNNSFWDPKSMDTLIFSSYVGGACIFEYCKGAIELLRANQKFAAIFGNGVMSIEDTLRLDWISCLTPESRELVRDVLRRSFETKEEYTNEYVFENIPGAPEKTYLRGTLRVIASSGDRWLVYCTSENITAQREAEENEKLAIRNNELLTKQLEVIIDNVASAVTAVAVGDGALRLIFANDRHYEQLGVSKPDGKDKSAEKTDFIYAEDREKTTLQLHEMNAVGEKTSIEYRIVRTDGAIRWMHSNISVINYPGVKGPVQLAVTSDITEQLEAVKKEQHLLAQMQALMEDMPGGFVRMRLSPDGSLVPIYFNEGFKRLTGMNREELRELFLDDILNGIHPEDHALVKDAVDQMLKTGRASSSRYRIRHKTDSYIWVTTFGRITKGLSNESILNAYFLDATDQVREEERQKSLMDNLPCGAGIYEFKDGRMSLTYQNKIYWELVGLNEEAYPDASEMSAVHPDDIPVIMQELSSAVEQRRDVACDIRLRHLTEGYRPVHLMGRIVFKETGGFLIYATFTPISEVVLEARRQQARLALLTNSIPGGIAVYEGRPDALDAIRVTYFSDGFCRLFGYTREEYEKLAEVNPLGLVASGDIPHMHESILALVQDGIPMDDIYRAKVNGGETKWINVKAVLGEPDGDRMAVNAVFFDVTERKEALEKLRVSEEVNRLAIQQSMSIVCQYDVASRRLTVPENADSIFEAGRVEEDIPHKPVQEGRVSPETADAYLAFYESILRGEKKGVARFQRISTQGWRWLEGHFTTIFADSGEPVTAVISIFDVTESMEKDAAYKKWKQSIRDKKPETYSLYRCSVTKSTVLETSEGMLIPESQLEKSLNLEKRTANYADVCVVKEDRQRYLSFMNRDAMLLRYSQGRRTDAIEYREQLPGTGYRWIRLSVDFVDSPYSSEVEAFMLFENIDEAKRAELAILDRAEKDQLTGVLNRSSFITKVEHSLGKQKQGTLAALFIIDLDGFKQVNDFFGHAAGDETLIEIGQKLRDTFRGNDLVCRLGGDEFMVFMGDVSYLGAVKERAALICALLHKSFSLEVQLSASIGISICPENGEDFASLYRKADAALYHVKGIGKDNYALYAENMMERERSLETAAIEKNDSAGTVYAKPKLRMLIVDDNEINREYLTGLFEDEYLIDTAAEGTAALIRLNRYGSGVSVVLLDLMMPGIDGFTVLRRMRESVTMQNIPVIVVSGMNERENALEAIKAGASDYITKPVDADLLKLRVASAISKAENEQLRAQNRYLSMQNEEAKRLAEASAHSEELSVALHAAEKADLAKSQFLSSMSHEIRTPLNAVIGYNTIARSEISGAKTEEERKQVSMKVLDCLTKSEVASRHLLTIINDVLDMSAIESGKLKVDDSPFDFRSLITSLTVMFFSQAKAKGVDFQVLFDKPTEEWFIGDQLRINQVLTNLLSNAVKFTPEGGSVTLAITEQFIDERSTGFRFIVSDTGIGMTQEYLTHIWTPFEQTEASISRRFGGSGLGLSITKNLVDLMGGSIAVESKSGVGSKFTVGLTLTRMEQPQKTVSVDFSTINALVVDDDVSTCDYIKLLFQRCGAECRTFTSGRQALKTFAAAKRQGKPFNVCLVDWRMPEMDGFTTISEIRRIAAKDLPIVVVTAYDFNEIAEHTEPLGIHKFVSKPLFQSSLFDLLATICGQQTAQTAEKPPKVDFDGARVLLVEDNNMNMEVAKHVLLSAKLAVDCAWNGREALDIFSASKPGTYKAVLMDVHMPEVDGYEATRMIRASDRPDAKSIPIIAMTADVFAEDIEQAHNAGMNDHVAKPIDVESLFQVLASYMEDHNK